MVDFSTEQNLPFTFKVVDGRGRTVAVDQSAGPPAALSSDETVVTVAPLTDNGDNTWSGVAASGAPGAARVSVTADADLGDGVVEVIGLLDVNVTLDPRTGARISDLEAGAPVDKPV